jgi:seryl-tRNA synthetase
MFDIKWIRDNPDAFDAGLGRRGLAPLSASLLEMDAKRRQAQTTAQEIQARRKKLSKQIGATRARGNPGLAMSFMVAPVMGENTSAPFEEGSRLKAKQAEAEKAARAASLKLDDALAVIPNLPAEGIPDGLDESANREERKVGTPPTFDFQPREHFDIGEALGLMDFDRAAKLSGARFVVLSGALARMERALASFMLDLHTSQSGYTEVNPPALVRDEALYGTGQLPKFSEDLFRTEEGFWLIPTAEVPLTNLVAGEILDEGVLPLRRTAMTWCFRSEAGSAGKDTRGMIRQHQFSKVEMVSVCHPDRSEGELEHMTACAEEVLKRLGLAYRVVTLCCGDMGFAARRTHDIEVWLPGQDRYREISSCSNCGDFQARRMKARFRPQGETKGTAFVHTLNGSGLAIGRTLVAILENYQRADGSVVVPDALRPYMGGLEVIAPDAG